MSASEQMELLEVFSAPPSVPTSLQCLPLARRSDPATSHAAAASARELQLHHHDLIVGVLKRSGALGKDGVAARCGLTGHACGKRLSELERMGLVKLTGKTVPSTSGRAEREWIAA